MAIGVGGTAGGGAGGEGIGEGIGDGVTADGGAGDMASMATGFLTLVMVVRALSSTSKGS